MRMSGSSLLCPCSTGKFAAAYLIPSGILAQKKV